MTEFETKDSGERQQWESGMQRDVQTGKPRFALMWTKRQPYVDQMVTRYANLLARGAQKYEDRNWEEGCGQEELDYAYESLGRHTAQLICGETDEDHAAAVWFNTQLIEYIRWRMAQPKKKRNGSAKRRRKAAEKARLALTESEINQRALQKATQIRRRERLLEAAKDLDAELTEDAKRLRDVASENISEDFTQTSHSQLPIAGYAARYIHDYEVDREPLVASFDGSNPVARAIVKRMDENLRIHLDGPPAPPPPFQQPAPLEPGFLKRFGYDSVKVREAELVQEPTIASYAAAAMDADVRKREAELWNELPKPWEKTPDSPTAGEWTEARFQKGDRVKIEARWFSLQPDALSATIEAYLPKSFENIPGHWADQYLVRIWDYWHKSYEVVADQALYQALDPVDRGE